VVLVDNANALPVRFLFRIYGEAGDLVFESWKDVAAATSEKWRVLFPAQCGHSTVELATRMADPSSSEDYAWAWFRTPALLFS
ncbi:MAG: hypothetical protein WB992_08805, partial [Bryobacteraceae bacterium]